MLNRLRRRLDALVERRVDARVDALVDGRVDARVGPRLEEALRRVEDSQRDYEARLAGTQSDFSYIRSEFDRIAPQVAAIEHRLEALRLRLALDDVSQDDVLVRAQAEHERARLRLELAAHYEERLRRLESDKD